MRTALSLMGMWVTSCVTTPPTLETFESVLQPGARLTMTTPEGEMSVLGVDALTREYSWESMTKRMRLIGRDSRWLGSRGLYRPFGDGTLHAVLEEGEQHFDTEEGARAWLERQQTWTPLVWTSDGLVAGWKAPKRPGDGYVALSVEVWQIYIRGRKPTQLAGARNAALHLSGPAVSPTTPVVLASAEVIEGRRFTGRALRSMADRQVPLETVFEVLERAAAERVGQTVWYSGRDLDPRRDVLVLTSPSGMVLEVER